jgi:hypothetical protein
MVVDASPDLVNPDFINLTDGLPADQRYSFIFEGTPQAIDHFIVNTVANSFLQRYHIARNNTDFPEEPGSLFAADATRPERNSDHDMPVGYFKFPGAATTTTVSDATAEFSLANQNVVLTANVTAAAGIVNEGTVTFTVRNAANAVVGAPVVGNVSGGVATANYTLPGGTAPQSLTITGEFSGGTFTAPSSDTATLTVTSPLTLSLTVTPTTVKRGKFVILKLGFANISSQTQNVSFTVRYTSPCGSFVLNNLGPIPVHAGANANISLPFFVPKKACTGLYTLTLEAYIGGVLVNTATAELTVIP